VHREFEAGNLTRTFRDVLDKLGWFARCNRGIFPSHRTLAGLARCCVRTVQSALQAARRLGLLDWIGQRVTAGWRVLRGVNRYVLKVPTAAVEWVKRSTGKSCRGIINVEKKEAQERHNGAIAAMVEAAKGLPDLLAARRKVMEQRWRRT
jgi:hypothetical protein